MNILLLTTVKKSNQNMLDSIIKEFVSSGDNVYVVCPSENKLELTNKFITIDEVKYLFVDDVETFGKVNIIKKVINFLFVDSKYKRTLKKAGEGYGFDLVLYSTPPITLVNTIKWIKSISGACTYLMLKDIFPQNAVDLGMIKKRGLWWFVWKYFRKKEKKLYIVSDFIGCMSPANCKYILENNELNEDKVSLCYNSCKLKPITPVSKEFLRKKYGLPADKLIFLYGGNLGKPQGLDFFVKVLESNQNRGDIFFLICGGGNDEKTLKMFIKNNSPSNVKLMSEIPKNDFEDLCRVCDVGMVFLDYRFTIPNFPSRILSYMRNSMPIVACTDVNTDVGTTIVNGGFGWWCESTDETVFTELIDKVIKEDLTQKGINSRKYLEENYSADKCCETILNNLYGCSQDVKVII